MAKNATLDDGLAGIELEPAPKPRAPLEKRWWYPLWRLFRAPMSKQEALYALLYAAILVDGEVSAEETSALDALCDRSRELAKLAGAKRQALREKVQARIAKTELDMLIDHASATVPLAWANAVYANVADLVFADRYVRAAEQAYLIALAEKLRVSPETARVLLMQVRLKNEHIAGPVDGGEAAPAAASGYEGLESAFAGLPGGLSRSEALYAVLLLAAKSGERAEPPFEHLAAISRSLRAVPADNRAAMHDKIAPRVSGEARAALLADVALTLKGEWALAALGQAADLVFADHKASVKEREFLKELPAALGIEPEAAKRMIAAMAHKNER